MKKLLILGAGTAGTMLANKLSHELNPDEWKITIVDQDEVHYYQPGFLFIPFGIYGENDVRKPKRDYLPPGVDMILSEIELIEPEENRVRIAKDNRILNYDVLIIATGTQRNRLGVPGEKELIGRGVSYCVDCDGHFYKNEAVAVVGNESAAVDGALTLADIAGQVYLVSDQLEVSETLQASPSSHDAPSFSGLILQVSVASSQKRG